VPSTAAPDRRAELLDRAEHARGGEEPCALDVLVTGVAALAESAKRRR
jgi:hypothetical protein